MKLKNKLLKYCHSEKIYLWEWILAAALMLLVMISFCYVDTRSLTIWSTNFWDVIWDGKPLEFWTFTRQNIHNVPHSIMANDIISILPLAIWNFPIWIAQRFFHYEINKNWILMDWSKLGFVMALVATAYLGYKICYLLTKDKHKSVWAAFLTFSCSMCINGVAYAGQNDIFFIFFSVLGVYYLLKQQKRWFIFFSAVSIAIKPFFIFVFVPLVLLIEKNVFKIILNCIGSMSIFVANRLIFSVFPGYSESIASGPSERVILNMFKMSFPGIKAPVSMFLIAWLVICFIAYITFVKENDERNSFIIFLPTAIYLMQCCVTDIEHYRMLLVMPFLAIFIMMNFERLRLNLALYAIFQYCAAALNAISSKYFMAPKYIKGTVIDYISGRHNTTLKYKDIPTFLTDKSEALIDILQYPVTAGLVVSAIIMLIINYPRNKWHSDLEKKGVFAVYDHMLLLLNTVVVLPLILLSYMIFLV